jgi:hypothetical protein
VVWQGIIGDLLILSTVLRFSLTQLRVSSEIGNISYFMFEDFLLGDKYKAFFKDYKVKQIVGYNCDINTYDE